MYSLFNTLNRQLTNSMEIKPLPIKNLISQFRKLPSIGPKSAQRMIYSMLNDPRLEEIGQFEKAFKEAREKLRLCKQCFNITENDLCPICQNQERDQSTVCVIEIALNIISIEESGEFDGLYHVLGGEIDPQAENNIEKLHIKELIDRIKKGAIKEIIIAANPSAEGDAAALYLKKIIEKSGIPPIKITRLGRGLPTGGDIEYADAETMRGALRGRENI